MSSINNSLLTNNNNISSLSDGKVKKLRKDAKGNLILKKEKKKIKSKFHAHLVDNLYPGKQIAHIIEIESFKKYNLESDENNIEEEPKYLEENNIIQEDKNITKQRCCNIF